MMRIAISKCMRSGINFSYSLKESKTIFGTIYKGSIISNTSITRHISDKKGPWGSDDGIESGFRPMEEGPGDEPWIPEFENKFEEGSEEKRSRLRYQSRKRGIAENGLLLGTFADKHLDSMSEQEMMLYDRLINLPTNDWDIYYWVTNTKPTPDEFDNVIMDKLKEHANNSEKESRISMPPLRPQVL